MKQVTTAELREHLNEHLSAVRNGEEVIVTDAGRPIARLSGLNDVTTVGASDGTVGSSDASAQDGAQQNTRDVSFDFNQSADHRGRLLQLLLGDEEHRR